MDFLLIIFFVSGFILKQIYKNHGHVKTGINNYMLYFGLPLLIFVSLVNSSYINIGKIISIAMLYNIFGILIFFILLRYLKIKNKTKAAIFLCSAFGNFAYLGIPYCFYFFGKEGAAIAAMFAMITALFHFSLGISVSRSYINKKSTSLKEMINPVSVGLVVAFIMSRFIFQVPLSIEKFAGLGTYLILFVIGLSVNLEKPDKNYIIGFLGRFVVSPILMIAILILTGFSSYFFIFLLLSLMPPAFTTQV